MNLYKIEVCAFGSFIEPDVNCPPGWRGSGCYDVEHECYQEASFDVAANDLDDALQLIAKEYEKLDRDWDIGPSSFYYDPVTVEAQEGIDDGKEEITDYVYSEPKIGSDYDAPARYCVEIV